MRIEFERRCVYCRTPDSLRGEDGFGSDHYRPKVIFPELSTAYTNLFYCCNQCNSRKSNFWPADDEADLKFIPNPCAHRMFEHLRFVDGEVEGRSIAGKFAIDQLDLNDPETVAYRRNIIHLIDVQEGQLETNIKMERQLNVACEAGKLSRVEYDVLHIKLIADRNKIQNALTLLRGG